MSNVFIIGVELVFTLIERGKVREVDLVPKDAANASKAFYELRTLLRAVGDEFQVRAEVFVLVREPFEERLWFCGLLHLQARGGVHELLVVLLIFLAQVLDNFV